MDKALSHFRGFVPQRLKIQEETRRLIVCLHSCYSSKVRLTNIFCQKSGLKQCGFCKLLQDDISQFNIWTAHFTEKYTTI